MRYRPLVFVSGLAVLFGTSGCAAMFVTDSKDPMVKLAQAHDLANRQGRPLAADRLIHQARAICEERKEDKCLAHALKSYGWFLVAPGFEDDYWSAPYTRGAGKFLDSTVTLENRKLKAVEYFTRARELFLKDKVYSEVVNIDVSITDTYVYMSDTPNACFWITKSLPDFEAAIAQDPNLPINIDKKKWPTWADFVAWRKKDLGCAK